MLPPSDGEVDRLRSQVDALTQERDALAAALEGMRKCFCACSSIGHLLPAGERCAACRLATQEGANVALLARDARLKAEGAAEELERLSASLRAQAECQGARIAYGEGIAEASLQLRARARELREGRG